ncbi:MAG TPA: hypothetical protein ENK43_05505 [Planctomycetes bacterium]|nr:hypothetical protein [Planctomycetota bacterium]
MDLNSCPQCRRQYDVSHLDDADQILCLCGATFTVLHHAPKDRKPVRCGGCGAPVEPSSRTCNFCQTEVTLEEKRLSSICPECLSRLSTQARFCTSCGVPIEPQSLTPIPKGSCPRCKADLRTRDLGDAGVIECSACGGLWIPPEVFEGLIRKAQFASATATLGLAESRKKAELERHDFHYLPCPVCDDMMVPRNFDGRSGILLDVCREHGVWLDRGELEAAIRWARQRGASPRGGGVLPPEPTFEPRPEALKGDAAPASPTSLMDALWGVIDELFG